MKKLFGLMAVLLLAMALFSISHPALAEDAEGDAENDTATETTDETNDADEADETTDETTDEPSAAATDEETEKIKAKMVENYLLLREAMQNADSDRIISFEAPEYVYVSCDRKVLHKAEADAMTHAGMNRFHKVHYANIGIKHFNRAGDSVVIVSESHLDADVLDENKKPRHLHMSGKSRDTWVKVGYEWMLKRSECQSCAVSKDKH